MSFKMAAYKFLITFQIINLYNRYICIHFNPPLRYDIRIFRQLNLKQYFDLFSPPQMKNENNMHHTYLSVKKYQLYKKIRKTVDSVTIHLFIKANNSGGESG